MRIQDNLKFGFLLLPPLALVIASLTWTDAAHAGKPRCYMHGILLPTAGDKPALSDMIRLHFDADDKKKCERMFVAYCQYNIIEKNYSPERLKATFKIDVDKTEETTYTLSSTCKLISSEEEEED